MSALANDVRIDCLRGEQVNAHLQGLAELRITVFREWPYLYEGSLDYERRYLDTYVRCPDSLVVLVRDGDRCVGASTVLPLVDAEPDMQAPFAERGMAIETLAYFGESLLLRDWRGRGLGVKFFDLREAHARSLGLSQATFCAVQRPDDHAARPADHVPNDAFWNRRGYAPVPGLHCHYHWPDVGESSPSSKPMQFWIRSL